MKGWIGAHTFDEDIRSEGFMLVGWKCNELLYFWRGEYWRWTRSAMAKGEPLHVFEQLTDEHKEGWNLK